MSSSRTRNLIRSRKFNINNCNSLKCLTAIAYTLCQATFIMKDKFRIQELERQLELAENANVYTKERIERLFDYYAKSTGIALDGALLAFILNNVA